MRYLPFPPWAVTSSREPETYSPTSPPRIRATRSDMGRLTARESVGRTIPQTIPPHSRNSLPRWPSWPSICTRPAHPAEYRYAEGCRSEERLLVDVAHKQRILAVPQIALQPRADWVFRDSPTRGFDDHRGRHRACRAKRSPQPMPIYDRAAYIELPMGYLGHERGAARGRRQASEKCLSDCVARAAVT